MKALKKSLYGAVNGAIEPTGFQIVESRVPPRTWLKAFRTLRARDFAPRFIVDVGVADGTPDLYRCFPEAEFLLIEPLEEYRPDLERICRTRKADYILAAAGAAAGEMQINVRPDDLDGSSLYRDRAEVEVTLRTVPVVRLDDVVPGDAPGPLLIKIDVQGAELETLRGATETLRRTDMVIAETSVIATLHEAPELFDMVAFMHERGFVVFDVLGGLYRPLDGALAQLDLVFVPRDHPLRRDRRWQA